MLKINSIKPLFNKIVTTCDTYESDKTKGGIIIKTTIEALPLKEDLTEEEFSKLRTNFNIPSLGKLSCTLNKYKGTKSRFKLIEKFRNAENK